jgi:hypothetical protein
MRQAAPGAQGPGSGYQPQSPFAGQQASAANPGYEPGYNYPQHAQPQAAPAAAPAAQRPGFPSQQGFAVQPANGMDPSQGYALAPHATTQRPFAQQQAHPGQQHANPAANGGGNPGAGSFRAPSAPFPGPARAPAADPMSGAAGYDQWPIANGGQDPRNFDIGGYMPTGQGRPDADPLQPQADWSLAAHGYDETMDPQYQGQQGFEPAQAGALEHAYSEDAGEYDTAEPRRGSWALRIAGAIVVAVGLGYGLAQGYKAMIGPATDGTMPLVKSDEGPTKTKPSDPGGKQFAHTDSKVMGRLGEPPPSAEAQPAEAAAAEAPAAAPAEGAAEADPNGAGARKVTTVMVGRDGTILPPEAPAEPGGSNSSVGIPGLTMVDSMGGGHPAAPPPAQRPVTVKPPAAAAEPAVTTGSTAPQEPAEAAPAEAAAPPPPAATAASETGALPPPAKHTAKKTVTVANAGAAAGSAAAPAAASAGGANGYVVVLASVPASGSSRLVALKKFADMQQQYGTVLQNKTPDVREANLGEKGIYHRLLVGPPVSRAQASTLCSELKTAGYKDCWVTAY